MIRSYENPLALKAGVLALLVHGLFFLLLVVSFNWRVAPPLRAPEVELWDSLPTPVVPQPEPQPEPPRPEPVPRVEPEPEPPPPPPEPKAEIVVKPKPVVTKPEPKPEKKPKEKEIPKPDPAIKAREEEQQRLEEIKKQLLAEESPLEAQRKDAQQAAAARAAQSAAASSSAVNEYKAKIQSKIKRYVNRQLCGSGKPVLEFAISLMPTGEVIGTPRLTKPSGIAACDQAVERAILQAQPLPVPSDAELFAQFRDLSLQFRPNDDN